MDARVTIVTAIAENWVIGRGNDIPWNLPADRKRFHDLTRGHMVIVGRKTHESILKRKGKPLPDRRTVVLTRQQDYDPGFCQLAHSWEEVEFWAEDEDEIFVIGGAEVYRLALPYADRLCITWVLAEVKGDAYFPVFDKLSWHPASFVPCPKDAENEFNSTYEELERRKT